ncbi:MAG: HAD family hydrolase [Caulobacteraceae bacterium]
MFDAVIFDCDGCLVDSEILALEVELQALAEAGMTYERAAFCRRFMGLTDAAFFAALDADRLAALGEPLPVDFRRRHDDALLSAVDERLVEVAGATAAVAALGRPKAVASSSHRVFLERKLRRVGLWEAFAPHVYSSDDVARGKPAPDLFLHAAAALGVPPGRCLVIEDSVNGVLAARAAGMTTWGLTAGGHIQAGDIARLRSAGAHATVGAWRDAQRAFSAWR